VAVGLRWRRHKRCAQLALPLALEVQAFHGAHRLFGDLHGLFGLACHRRGGESAGQVIVLARQVAD